MPASTTLYHLPYPQATDTPQVHLDLKALAEAVDTELGSRTLYVAERTTQAGPVGNPPSSAVSVIGLDGSFTLARKTRVRLQFDSQFFVSNVDTVMRVELFLNGTSYRLLAVQSAVAAVGNNMSGGRNVTLNAGTYTVAVYVSREVGTGNVTLDGSANNPIQFTVTSLGVVP